MTGGLRLDVLCSKAFVCWIVVERDCPVAGADGVEVRVDGNVGSDAVE